MKSLQILFYATPQGSVQGEVFFEDETFWLSQKKMAEFFGVDVRTVNEHLRKIFSSDELLTFSTIRNFRIVEKVMKQKPSYSNFSNNSIQVQVIRNFRRTAARKMN